MAINPAYKKAGLIRGMDAPARRQAAQAKAGRVPALASARNTRRVFSGRVNNSAALKLNPSVEPMWIDVCAVQDLPHNAGVAARVAGRQIALFYLPAETPAVYALDNWDPLGGAAVLARGIVGDLGGQLVVASPLYKQHFRLADGQCLEDPAVQVAAYPVCVDGDRVSVALPDAAP